jgi:hypothetical protein
MQPHTTRVQRLLLRGYGPLMVLVIGFGLVALTAPPVDQQLAGEQQPPSDGDDGPSTSGVRAGPHGHGR